ncbi:PAS domain-containing protein [[Mycobacterium] crassicus]|uniref:PAS domain-containing protein n=1 Tax=[Mycobacterium] crassicus TaxID=2872309 RepID=A0ABU5XIW8_9MYCO|nr:PAS domain-containing protein [Mycolicibacter sp. MYC098]MEB3022238.1 PAS domain-containing protein [Mycolicibacter sp. MYC098]
MAHDWLLVETLGDEPAVVAQGRQVKNLVPISQFLRRSPHLAAIQTAIAETMRTGQSLASITPRNDRVIRTEPVVMSDDRVHGVHVWSGPPDVEPPERPIPGPLKWNLTLGVATDTKESLANIGKDPEVEATHGRVFAEELPARDFSPNENKVLALTIRAEPGQTICSSWDVTDFRGEFVRVGFVARNAWEPAGGGREHLVSRGMNWRGQLDGTVQRPDFLAQQILHGLAQPGMHRAMVDMTDWRLLKWLDDPCPFYDWRGAVEAPRVHPDDEALIAGMAADFTAGPTVGVLRLRHPGGGWEPVHVTVNRVEIDEGTYAGLVAMRLPTESELADAGFGPVQEP